MKKILLFLCIVFLSCDKKGPTEFGFSLTDVRFVAGKHYTYAWISETRDSLGNLLSTLHDTLVVVIETSDDMIDTASSLIRLRAYSLVDSTGSVLEWYRNKKEDFCNVAYSGAGQVPIVYPKKGLTPGSNATFIRPLLLSVPRVIQIFMRDRLSQSTDSVIFRSDPRVVYKYPMSVGQSWVSFTDPFLQTREVIGSESIQTGVGSRYCVKIKTDSPTFGGSIEWFDFVDEEGLMLRSLTMEAMVSGPEGPEPIGILTILERTELLSITQ